MVMLIFLEAMAQIQSDISSTQTANFIPSKLSYEEFLRQYDGKYVEYVNSEVIGPMTVGFGHDQLTGFLRGLLQVYVEEKGLGRVCGGPFQMKMEFEDGIHGREPDVFFVKHENISRLTDRYYDGGADLAIEVVSPDSVVRDTQDKFEEYQTAGVKEYWIIDPLRKTAKFYGFGRSGKYELLPISSEGRFESQVIEGLWINTDWLWQEPLPNLMQIAKELKLA
jgi:Uma2 family endonuclease